MTESTVRSSLPLLSAELQNADARALLVPARVLQRVIRFDRRLSTLELGTPHSDCYFISRDRLLDFTSRYEYQLALDRELPETLLLFPEPEADAFEERTHSDLCRDYWRRLFHLRAHLDFQGKARVSPWDGNRLLEGLHRLGSIPFAEARATLRKEELLLPPMNFASIFAEWAATFLELWHFRPELLSAYFPGIQEPEALAEWLSHDIDHARLRDETKLAGAAPAVALSPAGHRVADDERIEAAARITDFVNARAYQKWLARSFRRDQQGNYVQAAILRQKAARRAPVAQRGDALALARQSLTRLATELVRILELTAADIPQLVAALEPILEKADRRFRQLESRMLYDLQKVCNESERGVYAVDLWRWISSAGRTPLRRPLPLLREMRVSRHLRAALAKYQVIGHGRAESDALCEILEACVQRTQESLRHKVRPLIAEIFMQEGCAPQNVVEIAALRKVVEELVDRVVEHGQLSVGHLRDAVSQSNIKLPDLVGVRELVTGDQLLRIDRRLARALDGIYHRGPIYLRMAHRLSSLAFGTRSGRIMTRYVALPFGGAYLVLESFRHILHFLFPNHRIEGAVSATQAAHAPDAGVVEPTLFSIPDVSFVLLFGIFLMLLIENPRFRQACAHLLRRLGQGIVYLVRDFPEVMLRLPWVRRIFESPAYVAVMNYGVKPLIITSLLLLFIDRIWHWLPERRIVTEQQLESVPRLFQFFTESVWWVITFLAINLFLNAPLGRYVDAWIKDHVRRGWRELQMRVFAATFRFIVDSFQWMLRTIEQIIYTVDELLRFRSGERWPVLIVKAVVGFFWSVVSYIVRIYITLLIEPQINPIKHFPVVTVSHKMILPFSFELTKLFATPLMPLGPVVANTIAGTTVFLLPGVFGFLAWELKENWRLYSANRSVGLHSIAIGSHGETMTRLLRPGFHSGTIPKLFAKLRKAWHKADETGQHSGVAKVHEKLHHVAHSIQVFVEREWVFLLRELPSWAGVRLHVHSVRLGSNQVEFQIGREGDPGPSIQVRIADLGGWLVAWPLHPGWIPQLSAQQKSDVQTAFRGLYRYAGIDLIWDDVLSGLGLAAEPYWYDMNRDGLQIWMRPQFDTGVQYKLRDMGATAALTPQPKFVTAPRQEDVASFVFSQSSDSWNSWVAIWNKKATESRDSVAVDAIP